MSETKTAFPTEVLTLLSEGVATLGEVQHEQGDILTQLQARPIPDLAGIERRLDEYADAVERLRQETHALVTQKRRPWWTTAALVTLAYVGGVLSLYGVLVWQSRQVGPLKQTPAAVSASPQGQKRGR